MPVEFICIFVCAWPNVLKGWKFQNDFQLQRATEMLNFEAGQLSDQIRSTKSTHFGCCWTGQFN